MAANGGRTNPGDAGDRETGRINDILFFSPC